MELKDRVIVVTGGARGIGRALAMRFASEGARGVVVADIDGALAQDVASQIGARPFQCDVSREADIARLIGEVESAFGHIDIFCSNAGIAVEGGPEAPDADWQRIWSINVMAHVYVARHALPGMLARIPAEGGLVLRAAVCDAHDNRFGGARRDPEGSRLGARVHCR